MNRQFQHRVEAIFKDFEVFSYAECVKGPVKFVAASDRRPWIEFDLRPKKRRHSHEGCHVPVQALAKLAILFGTWDVTAAGFDLSDDGTDQIGYVLARGVQFKGSRRG